MCGWHRPLEVLRGFVSGFVWFYGFCWLVWFCISFERMLYGHASTGRTGRSSGVIAVARPQ